MRIAQIAPLFESVPPELYGGSERVISWLTEELVRMGHHVTLFASGDSTTSASLAPMCCRALWRDPQCRETLPHHLAMVEEVLRRAAEFDILHFHCDYVHFPLASRSRVPSLTTLHGLIHPPDLERLFRIFPEVPLVSISDSQRKSLPQALWAGTVYHGMPRELHSFTPVGGDYLLFLGRISPDKGIERASEIADMSRTPLRIAAKIYEEDRSYYEERIRPLIDQSDTAEYLGEIGGRDKDLLLGHAKALLFPIEWEEPFGLVMIEALACGTPVIAYRRGAVSEIIRDGIEGFIVNSIPESIAAITRLGEFSRERCRERFERNFWVEQMAAGYLALYEQHLSSIGR